MIASALILPRRNKAVAPAADQYDRRIVTVLAFGSAATTIALSAITGRGTIAMWGYPLWLFFGLWVVLEARMTIEPRRLVRTVATWSVIFAAFGLVFLANYSVLPSIDHRYRAAFYPGDRLADEMARGFRAATGRPLAYVIASMWDGGNVAHYAREQPRVLITAILGVRLGSTLATCAARAPSSSGLAEKTSGTAATAISVRFRRRCVELPRMRWCSRH